MLKKIVIIGAGQLGSRHLQALKKVDFPASIEVVDKKLESLNVAEQRYNDIPDNENIKSVKYFVAIDELSENIDLCIIATNADIRAKVSEELIRKKNVKNIIFEKILFQTVEDYFSIDKLLQEKNINAWVNCPRRYFPVYQQIKNILANNGPITINTQAGNSGLVTACIHLLDLLVYLNHGSPVKSFVNFLNDSLSPTKREGFLEVSGVISFELENGARIMLSSQDIDNTICSVDISNSENVIVVREENGTVLKASKKNNWKKETEQFNVIYQSNLSHIIAKNILIENCCKLTSFKESMQMHLLLLDALKETFHKNELYKKYLPIT